MSPAPLWGALTKEAQDFVAIPYFAWAHRGAGKMTAWIPNTLARVTPLGSPPLSATSRVSSSGGDQVASLNDQLIPKNSQDPSNGAFVWNVE